MKSIRLIIILLMALQPALSQTEKETRMIKGFLPIIENNLLSGFFMVASEIKVSHERTYYITKCDVNLNVIATFEEKRKAGDEVSSMAFNNKALCIVYASKGQNELVTYEPLQLAVMKRLIPPQNSGLYEHMAASLSKLYAYANEGFFFNKYTIDDKALCHFIGLDNRLKQIWEFKSNLGFENENVIPITEKVASEKYFVNHIIRRKNAIAPIDHNPSLIVNSTKNGSLVLHNNYDISEEIIFVDHPEVYVEDTTDMAYLVGDYVHLKTKARGWILSKMDLKNKTKTNLIVNFNSPDVQKFLDVEYQALASQNRLGFFPYTIQKFKEGFLVVGEIYEAKAKNIIDFGLTGSQDGYSQSVFFCELDKDLKIVSIKYQDVTDHKVAITGKESRYTTNFTGSILDTKYDNELKGLILLYQDEVSDKQVDYCKILYAENGMITVPYKKSFKRNGAHEELNIFEGKTKFTVFRKDNSFLEITQE